MQTTILCVLSGCSGKVKGDENKVLSKVSGPTGEQRSGKNYIEELLNVEHMGKNYKGK
jgi:hypothetical protein